jgi:hypothetical protein
MELMARKSVLAVRLCLAKNVWSLMGEFLDVTLERLQTKQTFKLLAAQLLFASWHLEPKMRATAIVAIACVGVQPPRPASQLPGRAISQGPQYISNPKEH